MNSSTYFSRNPRFTDDFERSLTNDLDHQLRRGKASVWKTRVRRLGQRLLAFAMDPQRSRPH